MSCMFYLRLNLCSLVEGFVSGFVLTPWFSSFLKTSLVWTGVAGTCRPCVPLGSALNTRSLSHHNVVRYNANPRVSGDFSREDFHRWHGAVSGYLICHDCNAILTHQHPEVHSFLKNLMIIGTKISCLSPDHLPSHRMPSILNLLRPPADTGLVGRWRDGSWNAFPSPGHFLQTLRCVTMALPHSLDKSNVTRLTVHTRPSHLLSNARRCFTLRLKPGTLKKFYFINM